MLSLSYHESYIVCNKCQYRASDESTALQHVKQRFTIDGRLHESIWVNHDLLIAQIYQIANWEFTWRFSFG